MILEIGIDRTKRKATVEGTPDHSHRGRGGQVLRWMCDPDGDHASWRVEFPEGSPFTNGKTEFGGERGADGGVLRRPQGDEPERYRYDVWCTDGDGTTYDTDPEVVLWPD